MVPTRRRPLSAERANPSLRGRVLLVRQQKSFPRQEPSMTDDIVSRLRNPPNRTGQLARPHGVSHVRFFVLIGSV